MNKIQILDCTLKDGEYINNLIKRKKNETNTKWKKDVRWAV